MKILAKMSVTKLSGHPHLYRATTQSALLEAVWVFVMNTQSLVGSRNPLWVVITNAQSVLGLLTHFG